MWPESARGLRNRWRGFQDPFGDRIVIEAATGIRSEGLIVNPQLVQGPDALACLTDAVANLSNVAHPALRAPRELQRLTRHEGRPVIVGDYTVGQRLSAWLATRGTEPLPTACVLHVALQVGGALRTIAEHRAGAFHGSVGLERVVLTPAGQVFLVEPALGALLGAQPEKSAEEWWRDYRVAVPLPSTAAAFGQTTDAGQLGVLILELLLGRPLAPEEYPAKVAVLLGTAFETDLLGAKLPIGSALFDWMSFALGIEAAERPPTMPVVVEALENLLSDIGGYVAMSEGLEAVPESLLVWPLFVEDPLQRSRALDQLAASTSHRTWPHMGASSPSSHAGPRLPAVEPELQAAVLALGPIDLSDGNVAGQAKPHGSGRRAGQGTSVESLELEWNDFHASETSGHREVSSFRSGEGPLGESAGSRRPERTIAESGHGPEPPVKAGPGWTRLLRWGVAAVAATSLLTGAGFLWRQWQDRRAGPPTVSLDVDSQPGGATILINGVERGKAPVSVAVNPGRYTITAKSAFGLGTVTVDATSGSHEPITVPLQLASDPGSLDLATEPAGAEIVLDNEPRGRSPMTLEGVPPGDHHLIVEHGAVRIERRFTLAPTERLTLFVPLAGWVVVRSPLPLEVTERGRLFGTSTDGRVLVPAGRRRLQLVNHEFGVNATHEVLVMAGHVADVSVALPPGMLSVVSDVPADVWLDGEVRGRTPTGNLSVALGEHDVRVTHPRWGEQRLKVIVGLGAPTRLSVKLSGADSQRAPQRGSPKRSGISAAR